jgi:hypothetical protein
MESRSSRDGWGANKKVKMNDEEEDEADYHLPLLGGRCLGVIASLWELSLLGSERLEQWLQKVSRNAS